MMNTRLLIEVGVGAALVVVGVGLFVMRETNRQSRRNQRIEQIKSGRVGMGGKAAARGDARHAFKMIAGVGQGMLRSGVISSQTADALKRNLEGAGIRNPNAVGVVFAGKFGLALVLPIFTFLLVHNLVHMPAMRNMLLGAAAVLGLLLPDIIIRSLRKGYQKKLADGLPDALDMLVMCAESGLSLEPAVNRVGLEIQSAHPAVGTELLITSSEFQISTDSQAVLVGLGERTGLAEVKRVCATLGQTLQYGTPLAEALRVLSAEMRGEILTRFEEKAAKLPVLLTLPMIMFILPSLFLVVGGPAIIQALRLFK